MESVIGVDVGQKHDPTAICAAQAEVRHVDGGRKEIHFLIRYLERLPIGTRYPEVADRLCQIAARVRERSYFRGIYVDATGVGQPIVDLVETRGLASPVIAVYFTHGDRRTEVDSRTIYLGKAFLVSRLQMLLQCGRVHLPRTPEAEALAAELLDYEIRVDQNANERFGAFKVGTHDDLVTALGLALQIDLGPRSKVFRAEWY